MAAIANPQQLRAVGGAPRFVAHTGTARAEAVEAAGVVRLAGAAAAAGGGGACLSEGREESEESEEHDVDEGHSGGRLGRRFLSELLPYSLSSRAVLWAFRRSTSLNTVGQ